MVKSFIAFSQKIDILCRKHCIMSIFLAVSLGIFLIGLQCLIYYLCHSYFLVVSGWSIGFVIALILLFIAMSIANLYTSWHIKQKIGLRETIDFKHMKNN